MASETGDSQKNPSAEYLTKRQYAAHRLREMIVASDLPPNTPIRQQEMARLLGTSATPVREAIWQLLAEGFLESIPHVGFRVSPPHPERFAEALGLRLDLEGRLARGAASAAQGADVALLRNLHEQFLEAAVSQETRGIRRVNYRLHEAVWATARQPLTEAIVASLWAKFPRGALDNVGARAAQSAAEHHDLILAISTGDPGRAEAAMRSHILNAHAYWRERLTEPAQLLQSGNPLRA